MMAAVPELAKPDRRPWPAAAVIVVYLAAIAGILVNDASTGELETDPAGFIALLLAFAAYAVIGALIIWRRPGNRVGWVYAGLALLVAVGAWSEGYARTNLIHGGETTPLVLFAGWIGMWYWFPTLGLLFVWSLLLYPDGHLPSRRWRPVGWLGGVTTGAAAVLSALYGRIQGDGYSVVNPIGIADLEWVEDSAVGAVGYAGLLLAFLATVVSVFVRYRMSDRLVRAQLKWLALAAALMLVSFAAEEMAPLVGVVVETNLVFALTIAFVPVATGIAILRHGLYEIDRILSRTVSYGLVTAALIGVYLGAVFVMRSLLPLQGELAVAGSTLAVAALFNPLRRRVQNLVDRRFNRSRFDAQKTMEAFGRTLANRVALPALAVELDGLLKSTLQPAATSIWLRDGTGRG